MKSGALTLEVLISLLVLSIVLVFAMNLLIQGVKGADIQFHLAQRSAFQRFAAESVWRHTVGEILSGDDLKNEIMKGFFGDEGVGETITVDTVDITPVEYDYAGDTVILYKVRIDVIDGGKSYPVYVILGQ